jgi:hypothetical protein
MRIYVYVYTYGYIHKYVNIYTGDDIDGKPILLYDQVTQGISKVVL